MSRSTKARVRWAPALARVAVGTVVALLLIEVAVRVATGVSFTQGGSEGDRYVVIDPVVGRLPRAGLSMRVPKGFSINIGEHGTRRNGDSAPRAERPLVLAVGDSFAFGDEVNDQDTWPAALERLARGRVVNAGVPSFGLDQAVLRAEQLAAIYAPDTIVVSFIPHDVLRCEMSYWSGHPKPYFDVDAGGLHLRPAPVPPPSVLDPLKRLLSVSVTLDLLFPIFLHWEGPQVVTAHDRGREVACLLMERLAAFGRARNARIVVLAQPQQPSATPEHLELKDELLACAAANDLLTLDLFPVIEHLPPEQRERLFRGHMTAEGNRLVATELARFLEDNTAPPEGRR